MNDSTRTHGAPNRHVYDWEHEQDRPVSADRAAPPSPSTDGGAPLTQPRHTRELGQNEGQPATPIAGRLALGFAITITVIVAIVTIRTIQWVGEGTWPALLALYGLAGAGGALIAAVIRVDHR